MEGDDSISFSAAGVSALSIIFTIKAAPLLGRETGCGDALEIECTNVWRIAEDRWMDGWMRLKDLNVVMTLW